MTQVELQELEGEVAELQQLMDPKSSDQKSENRKAVQHLRSVVKDLKCQVDSRDNDILIYRNIESDLDDKLEKVTQDLERERSRTYHLERYLEVSENKHRKVEMENQELERIVFGKGMRGGYY